jgi:hypothetical protein
MIPPRSDSKTRIPSPPGFVEADLLGDHALGLDDALDAVPGRQAQDDSLRLFGVPGPVDLSAGGDDVLLHLGQVAVQVGQGVQADLVAGPAELLPALLAELIDNFGPFSGRPGVFSWP